MPPSRLRRLSPQVNRVNSGKCTIYSSRTKKKLKADNIEKLRQRARSRHGQIQYRSQLGKTKGMIARDQKLASTFGARGTPNFSSTVVSSWAHSLSRASRRSLMKKLRRLKGYLRRARPRRKSTASSSRTEKPRLQRPLDDSHRRGQDGLHRTCKRQ